MGILSSFKSAWKAASTAEKINMVLDVICGFGAAAKAYGPYTKAAGDIIDTVKQKNTQSKTKEDSGDGEYTRY